MIFLVLQLVCCGVGKLLLLYEECILCFLDIRLQHLHPALLQPAEWPLKSAVIGIEMGVLDGIGSGQCLSFALTKRCLRFLLLFRLKHGLGTCSSSFGRGCIVDLSFLMSRSSVYSRTKNVSYFVVDTSLPFKMACLLQCGIESKTCVISLLG